MGIKRNGKLKLAAAALAVALVCAGAAGARIKDIAKVYGPMENPLVGTALVVGLNGTGDDAKFAPAIRILANMLSRMGVEALPSEVMASKNVALVSVSATLPKFGRMGDWLKVDVAAVGNAKSLKGGRLVLCPLLAPIPGQQGLVTYAVAQGALKTDPQNLTTASIENGAIIQREVPADLTPGNRITFKLSDDYADCEVATLIVKVIHEDLNIDTTSAEKGGPGDQAVARAVDPATVEVRLTPQQAADPVPFISHLERLPVAGLSSAMEARVVIDEKNGAFYAINGNVEISPVVVGYRNLQLEIKADLDEATTLDDLVEALKDLQASPPDVIGLLEALKAAGALHAKVIRK